MCDPSGINGINVAHLSRVTLRALVGAALLMASGCVHGDSIPIVDRGTVADAAITAAVKTALLNDARVDGTQIVVTTQAGVVRLAGSQASRDAAAEVVSIVRGVDGVRDVQSTITVGPGTAVDSDAIR
jgi:hyperosmotically inducible protein